MWRKTILVVLLAVLQVHALGELNEFITEESVFVLVVHFVLTTRNECGIRC